MTDQTTEKATQVVEFDAQAIDVAKVSDMASRLKDAPVGMNMVRTYMEFDEIGTVFRGLWLGFTHANVKDEQTGEVKSLRCVAFYGEDHGVYVNAGTALMRTMEETVIPQFHGIEITYTGEKKTSGSRSMKVYAVRPVDLGEMQ